jgi:clan AA aspartic protease
LTSPVPSPLAERERVRWIVALDSKPIEHYNYSAMGEVRVKVKLTNAIDEALVRRGMLKPEQVRSYEADALVDTGAVRCILPPHVVERLGLAIIGQRVAEYADGRLDIVGLTEAFTLRVLDREELENALVLGDEVIIGQTALEKLDLVVDCVNRRLLPNPAHPDQPVSKVK